MKFVLFLIKTLSLILCAGLFGAYLYYTFLAKDSSEFLSNASLLLFVLSVVITSLAVVLTENPSKTAANNSGLDAYLAELRKEEKNATKQIQKVLPENLVPMLEKAVATISESREGLDRVVLDSKSAFSSALSENKTALSGMLGENRSAINDTLSENIRLLESRISESQNSFANKVENLLEQISNMAAKTLPPLNLALENINTRLDDLENKIISNRLNVDVVTNDSVQQNCQETEIAPATEIPMSDFVSEEKSEPITTETSAYDFSDFTKDSVPEPAEENLNDFTNLSDEPMAEIATEESTSAEPAEENLNDFTNLSDEPMAEIATEESTSAEPAEEVKFSNAYNDTRNDTNVSDNYSQFTNDLSELADLEIMQEPVAPTAEPKFDEIDIDEFLKGRSDVKN